MSAAPVRLALVPPSAEAPPPRAVNVLPSAALGTRAPRVRRVLLRCWLAGCVGGLMIFLIMPVTSGFVLFLPLMLGALAMPVLGIGLLCTGLAEHSRESLRALLVAGLALVAAIALVEPGLDIVTELFVAAHQGEMDALAGEIRAAAPREAAALGFGKPLDESLTQRFQIRLREQRMYGVAVIDGGLLFQSSVASHSLLYGDGVAGPPRTCAGRRLRALGGRWFESTCFREASSDD